jgi:hypothetical protein
MKSFLDYNSAMTRPAPIIAAVLLLLPLLYVATYLALVAPRGVDTVRTAQGSYLGEGSPRAYRVGSNSAATFYWPLEQIDRQVRPAAWSFGDFTREVLTSPEVRQAPSTEAGEPSK